ncbi:MAG: T9SS C-terminal target domain-containing protein [Ignavibacteriae bacterium]|nr:MAG: T9SS C-terminal target domain-containing protein [Ignavibacteriota bacterium]
MNNINKLFLSVILAVTILHNNTFHSQWLKQQAPVVDLLSCVKFINPNTGWVCSTTDIGNDTSFILKTTNGGIDWYKQFFGIGHLMRTVFPVNSSTIYVCGININMNPLLLKSTNGGLNWVNKLPPTAPYDLFFFNADSGWYCSQMSSADIRFTTDGGTTWQQRGSGIVSLVYRLFFMNFNTGWCGGNSFVHKTTNAGINWTQIGVFNSNVGSVYFYNQNTGWAGLSNGKVAYTSNGGNNWTYQNTPVEGVTYGITDLQFFDNLRGFAGNKSNKILKTYNGGQTWGYQIDTGYSERISFIDSLTGWSVFWHIRKTTNGGGQVFYNTGFTPVSNIVPSVFKLYQNYPNPFNPSTTIKLDIAKASDVSLFFYDMLGRVVYKITNQYLNAGSHEFVWNADEFCSGVYYCKIITDGYSDTRKMMLLK